MGHMVIELSMFNTLALAVLSLWFGNWLRSTFYIL